MLSLEQINKVVKYWWFRYLMVTEMYMVEKWEVIAIHAIFTIVFSVFWYINYSVVLGFVSNVVDNNVIVRDFMQSVPGLHHHSSASV